MGSVKREDLITFPSPFFFLSGGAQPPLCVPRQRAQAGSRVAKPPPKAAEGP
jgi:hypothetical protein